MAISMRPFPVSRWKRSSAGGRIVLRGGLPHACLLAPSTVPRASTNWTRSALAEAGIGAGTVRSRAAALHW
ncbi:hypothetical protein ACFQX6_36185 [Streptosporangium lutulentum]